MPTGVFYMLLLYHGKNTLAMHCMAPIYTTPICALHGSNTFCILCIFIVQNFSEISPKFCKISGVAQKGKKIKNSYYTNACALL